MLIAWSHRFLKKKKRINFIYNLFIYLLETVEKALVGVERVLIVHGPTDFPSFVKWVEVVIEAAKKHPSVKVIGKVSLCFFFFLFLFFLFIFLFFLITEIDEINILL